MEADKIYISNKKELSVTYINGIFNITCQLIDKANGIGIINDIKIYITKNLPGDLKNGDYIEFVTKRLDIFEEDMEILNEYL